MTVTNPWPFGLYAANRSTSMEVGGYVGPSQVGAQGTIDIGPGGGLGGIENVNHNYFGLFSNATVGSNFHFDGVSASTPLYYGIEWTVAVRDNGSTAGANLTLTTHDATRGQIDRTIMYGHHPLIDRTFTVLDFGSVTTTFGQGHLRVRSDSGLGEGSIFGNSSLVGLDMATRIQFSSSAFNFPPEACPPRRRWRCSDSAWRASR